jgi:hypothetical protein
VFLTSTSLDFPVILDKQFAIIKQLASYTNLLFDDTFFFQKTCVFDFTSCIVDGAVKFVNTQCTIFIEIRLIISEMKLADGHTLLPITCSCPSLKNE